MKAKVRKLYIIGNAVALLLLIAIFVSPFLTPLSTMMYDFNLRTAMSHMPHEDIIVIEIDEESLDLLGKFPWPRDVYAPLLEATADARVVAFDITFTTESDDKEVDLAFAEALHQVDNVIIPSYVELENFFRKETVVRKGELIKGHKVYRSIPVIAEAADTAHINAAIDDDGIIRRTWLMLDSPEGQIPSLAYRVAERYGADVAHYLSDHAQAELWIKYSSSTKDFMNIPFYMVLTGEVPPETFADRIVLVGMAAAGSDAYPTPVDNHMYLVYAHANIIDQLLQGEKILQLSDVFAYLMALLVFILTAWIVWRVRTIYHMAFVLIGSVILIYGQWLVFQQTMVYFDPVLPVLTLFMVYVLNISFRIIAETQQKQFLTNQFGRYVSPELVKEMVATGAELPLGGIKKELSILFLDIRGFTTLSEQLRPEEVVQFLNTMFDMVTTISLRNHGTIDKFMGDAAMILFNAPLDVPDHSYYAVKTAWDIQQKMVEVHHRIKAEHGVAVSIGIGVHTGEVVVGNIGSYLRVDYTAIGDSVNTAARIESITEANQIFVSEATYSRIRHPFIFRHIGEKQMKGKSTAIRLYEVVGYEVGENVEDS